MTTLTEVDAGVHSTQQSFLVNIRKRLDSRSNKYGGTCDKDSKIFWRLNILPDHTAQSLIDVKVY